MIFAAILVQDIRRFTFLLGNDFSLHFRDFDRGTEVHGSSNIWCNRYTKYTTADSLLQWLEHAYFLAFLEFVVEMELLVELI